MIHDPVERGRLQFEFLSSFTFNFEKTQVATGFNVTLGFRTVQ